MIYKFGTLAKKKNFDIKKIINENTMEIEYLFRNAESKLEKLTVIEAERQLAVENLRKLIEQLQAGRNKINSQPDFKYFTA